MDASIAELGAATALNPSFAVGQYTLGFALMQAGDTVRAIEMADKARRLSPYDPMSFAMIGVRGFSLALDGRHDEAVETLAMAIRQPNAHYHLVALAAVCDALAGREAEARRNLGRCCRGAACGASAVRGVAATTKQSKRGRWRDASRMRTTTWSPWPPFATRLPAARRRRGAISGDCTRPRRNMASGSSAVRSSSSNPPMRS